MLTSLVFDISRTFTFWSSKDSKEIQMKSSLSKIQLFDYIKVKDYNLPDNKIYTRNLKTMIFDGLDRLEYSFSNVKDKYFNDNNQACFNHLNSDHMVVLLYYISNTDIR